MRRRPHLSTPNPLADRSYADRPCLHCRASRSKRAGRPARILGAALALTSLVALLPAIAGAQVLREDAGVETEATTYRIGALEVDFASPHPDHPSLEGLLPLEVQLRRTPAGWAEPLEGEESERVRVGGPESPVLVFEASGVVAVLSAIVRELHGMGLYGVDVRPSSRDFDLANSRDLRPEGRDALAVEIRIGRVAQVRTIAVGDRVKSDWKIDNEIHQRIRENSPLQPAGAGDDEATDLLDRRALEDYLYRLNRHAGRRVEAALSPAETAGEVVVDYRVLEAKPWYAYAQVSNTGTRRTDPWQMRFGYSHRQLTDRDDILTLEYMKAGRDDVNAVTARYEAPFFRAERPEWLIERRGDPDWIEWLPRDEIPWWGIDRMRWETEFSWSRVQASNAATLQNLANDTVKSSQFLFGGRMLYEAFQHRNFFIDVWGGLRLRDVTVNNRTQASLGEALLVIPRIGLRAEKRSQISNLGANVSLKAQVNSINKANRQALGRAETDDRYAMIDWNLAYSAYLEPIVNPEAWRDPSTHTSSTLAHELAFAFRGQVTLDNERLIPQANGAIGGAYSVRGYPQSVAVGDSLLITSLEYRFHVPRVLPVQREPLRIPLIGDFRASPQQVYGRPDWDLVLRAFVDLGRTHRNGRNRSNAGAVERQQTLIGAGIGAELQIRSNLRASIDWATALKDENRTRSISSGASSQGADFGDSQVHVLFSILY